MALISIIKPPKFLERHISTFRKWKLGRYKKKKVRQEKTPHDRTYFIRFNIKIDDHINPQVIEKSYEMMVPARAAFFAKRKAKMAILEKIDIDFINCELINDDEFEEFELSKETYIEKKGES